MIIPRGKIDFKYNLRLYFSYLKNYKFLFLLVLAIILITESTYVFDKLLFKVIVDKGTEFSAKSITRNELVNIFLLIGAGFIILGILKAVLKFAELNYVNILESNLIADLKRKFFNHLLNLSYNFHTSHKSGSLISKLVRIGGAVERMTDLLVFNFAPLIFQLIVVFFSIIYFSFKPAIVVLVTILVFVIYSFLIQKLQEKSNVIANETEDIEKANVSDIFTNIEAIKYFGKETNMELRFKKLSELTKISFLKNWNYFRWFDAGQSLILSAGIILLFYFPLMDFINGKISIGTVVFIYTVFTNLIGPLFGFVHGVRNYYRAMADFEVLFRFAKIEDEIIDKKNAKDLKIKNGVIEFRDIDFKYGKRQIFKNFNLNINKNEKIALVGASGCGKTTLVKLLYRLYDINDGRILIDGEDIKDFKKKSLRSEMAIVPQECVLFDDSIYNNIAFSNPSVSKSEVIKAIKFAQLDRIIKDFPKKEKTIVGERGIRLSGGEKQRVSIARAILADKKILVLDEATSSLDSQTEHEIQRDLFELMKNRTSIIIAHRLSTIMSADKIVVMDKGKIVQIGNHEQLIKEAGKYKQLWNLQKGGYIK